MKRLFLVLAICAFTTFSLAQSDNAQESTTTSQQNTAPTSQQTTGLSSTSQVEPMAQTPVYRVNVVERTVKAVDYRHRSSSKIDFRGTDLDPQGGGEAKVESKSGRIQIDASFDHLPSARSFGPEYLTYVLWAITPDGRATNLGEVLVDEHGKSETKVTTPLQAFGMIVTAEPYFAITQPSNVVVEQNEVRSDTKGWPEPITAKFEAVNRDQYMVNVNPSLLPSNYSDKKAPLELLEARNAVYIATVTGADKFAPDALQKAKTFLARAEDYYSRKQNKNAIDTVARGATESAEDARVLSIREAAQAHAQEERRLAAERTAQAQARAEAEAQQRALAQQQAQTAEQQRLQAEQQAQQAAQQAQQAAQQRQQAEQDLQQAQAARQAAEQQRQQAAQEAEQARLQAQQAEQQRQQIQQQAEQTRARLLNQLNQVLQTRDTARGLISTMPDVLFDFNKYTLKPQARERLAKVAGILLAYPDLHLEIDGYTDSIGSDQYNQQLSEKRADAVRDYLASQGVQLNNVVAEGFGKNDPIASNATPQGRQENRRVELVVSGQAIGTNAGTGATPGANATQPATGNAGNQQPSTEQNPPSGNTAPSAPATTAPGSTMPGTNSAPANIPPANATGTPPHESL
ncbi:MAG TPA: OmpA family protein [Terriglobales bacterium]|nr:OmpA family protein [Terriglobales bacterium]